MSSRLGIALLFVLLVAPPAAGASTLHLGDHHHDARWRRIETEHFRIFFPDGSERTAVRTGRIAEAAWLPVTTLTGGTPPGRVEIVLRDFSDRSSGLARAAWPRIEIEPYPLDRDGASIDFLRQVVVHEFTHVAMFYAVGGRRLEPLLAPLALENLPDWWVEGLASAAEKRAAEPREEDLVRVTAMSGAIPTLRRLDDIRQGDRLDTALIYRLGESKIRYLAHRFGPGTIAAVHHAMRPLPWSFSHALRKVTGLDEGELDRAWREELAAYYPARRDGAGRDEDAPLLDTGPIERPLGAAWSSRGDLAVAGVRDEDAWWIELYLSRRESPGRFERIEGESVSPDFRWSPDGSSIVYSRPTPGRSGASWYDLYRYDLPGGKSRRLTFGKRLISPVWIDGGRKIAAITWDDSAAASRIVVLDTSGSVEKAIPPPPGVLLVMELAASPDGSRIAFTALTDTDRRDLFLYDIAGEKSLRLTTDDTAPFEPVWRDDETVVVLLYRGTLPERTAIHIPDGAPRTLGPSSRAVHDLFVAPDGEILEVSSAERYRSSIRRGDLLGAAKPPWNTFSLFPPLSEPVDSPGAPPRGDAYHGVLSVRPRPDAAISSVSESRVALEIRNLLSDPVDLHRISAGGSLRYDRKAKSASVSYIGRAMMPTLRVDGRYGEEEGVSGPWRSVDRAVSARLDLPVRRDALSSQFTMTAGFSVESSNRIATDSVSAGEERLRTSDLIAGAAWRRSRPREGESFNIQWRRGMSSFSSTSRTERWSGAASLRRAIIRSDSFLRFHASAAAETGGEKTLLAEAPAGIASPSGFAAGDAIAGYGVDGWWPLSEDLGIAAGPFYLERFTYRTGFAEGRSWVDGRPAGIVRSVVTELDLTIFSGQFLPFLGTDRAVVRAGFAAELSGGRNEEWFFALQSSLFSDRWTREKLSADVLP